MAGTLSVYHAGVYRDAYNTTQWGSLVDSQKDVSVTPKLIVPPTVRTVAVGEKVHLWTYDADAPDIGFVEIWLPDQSGNIDVGLKFLQTSDMTSNPRWRTFKMGCHSSIRVNEDDALLLATATDDVGETTGFPTVWGGTGVACKLADVAVMNPSTASAAVRVAYVVIGGAA